MFIICKTTDGRVAMNLEHIVLVVDKHPGEDLCEVLLRDNTSWIVNNSFEYFMSRLESLMPVE